MPHTHRPNYFRPFLLSAGLATATIALAGCSMFSSSAAESGSEPPLADLPAPGSSGDDGFFDPFATGVEGRILAARAMDTPGAVLATAKGSQPAGEGPTEDPGDMGIYGQVGGAAPDAIGAEESRTSRSRRYDGAENLTLISHGAHGADFDPDIARDGKQVIFASTQHHETADIYLKRVNGRSITQLTSDPGNDVMPKFSPDGRRVAFCSDRGGAWDVFIMNAGGGQAVQVTDGDGHSLHPTWSPDGSMMAFCRLGPVSGRWELWVLEVENPAVRHFIGYGLFPEWNPVSNKILFQRARDRGDRLFSVWTIDFENGEGRNPTQIMSSPSAAIVNPTWSPDGARIAFATITSPAHVYGERPDSADLWIVNADGGGRANLTNGSFVNLMPTWGRDNRIYFVSDRSGRDSIWSVLPERAIIAAGGRPTQNLANVPDDDDGN